MLESACIGMCGDVWLMMHNVFVETCWVKVVMGPGNGGGRSVGGGVDPGNVG